MFLASLHMFSVPWNSGCLQKSGNLRDGQRTTGGRKSPICYLKGPLRGSAHCDVFFLSQASHYYKYRQQFIFPGEFHVSSVPPEQAL